MANGQVCYDKCDENQNSIFLDGITNGAAWYSLYGGMQDWNYEQTNDFDITLELGCNMYPPAANLAHYWEHNKRALLNYIKEVHRGVKGTVSDAVTGALLANVRVHVVGRSKNITSSAHGDYFRLLLPGYYEIMFEHPNYNSQQVFVSIKNTLAQIIHIKLQPVGVPVQTPDLSAPTAGALIDHSASIVAGESSEHSLIVSILVMTVVILVILVALAGSYVIQKRRFASSQSMSVELQPTSRSGISSGTGTSLAAGRHLPGSSTNPTLSP